MEVSGQLHAPACLPPGKIDPGAHWTGGWVGPRAGLDEEKNLVTAGNQTPAVQPIATPTPHKHRSQIRLYHVVSIRPPLWSSSWLQIQKSRVRFLALPDFLRSSVSGTGSTQPREDNWGATWKSSGSGQESRINGRGIRCADHATPSIRKRWHCFADKRRSLGRYNSLSD
jgi:hypothetical protein